MGSHADDAWIGTGSMRTTKYFPIIRYAEILLGYVEAINHLSKSYTVELPAINGGNNAPQSYTVERIPTEIQKYFNPILKIASVCLDYLTQKPHQMKQLWTTSSRENI